MLPLGALLPNNHLNAPNPGAEVDGEGRNRHHHHRHRHHQSEDASLYKEDDILLSLQLLVYLSRYPRVRPAFCTQRLSFHLMTVFLQQPHQQSPQDTYGPEPAKKETVFFKAFTSRGKEKFSASANAASSAPTTAPPQQPP